MNRRKREKKKDKKDKKNKNTTITLIKSKIGYSVYSSSLSEWKLLLQHLNLTKLTDYEITNIIYNKKLANKKEKVNKFINIVLDKIIIQTGG